MRTVRQEFNRLLGLRSAKDFKRKPQIIPEWHKTPRAKALGKNKNSTQGVGGWRQNYHRPHEVVLTPVRTITVV